ncbi:MAG: hypothetical protein WD470_02355, partial [Rhodospirillaceae bacterium]
KLAKGGVVEVDVKSGEDALAFVIQAAPSKGRGRDPDEGDDDSGDDSGDEPSDGLEEEEFVE